MFSIHGALRHAMVWNDSGQHATNGWLDDLNTPTDPYLVLLV